MFNQQKQQQNSRLGNILLKRHCVTQQQLDEALIYQQQHQLRLGEALMEMKLIDQKTLTSALRKQSWVRVATTCLSLTLAPLSPAFASSQGKLGSSSSASSQISLTIQPETVNNGASDIQFKNDSSSQVSSGICTSNFDTDIYSISAKGSGNQGEFTLENGEQEKVSYDVAYKYQGQSFESLNDRKGSKYFQNKRDNQTAAGCFDAENNRLKVSLNDKKNLAHNSNYTGFLTITIAAE